MMFECGHAAQYPFVHKVRETPFHRLFHLGAGRMNQPSNMREDRFGKVRRLGDIRIDPSISSCHISYFFVRRRARTCLSAAMLSEKKATEVLRAVDRRALPRTGMSARRRVAATGYAFFAAVLSTLICRNRAMGHPWLTALAWVGSPLPSLAAPMSSEVAGPPKPSQ